MTKSKDTFWTDVLKSWCEFNYFTPVSKEQVRKQVIWFNLNIKVDNTLIYYEKWCKEGIIRIEDLLDEEDNFLSISQLNRKHKENFSFMHLYGIINAIPQNWKRWLKDHNEGQGYQNWYQTFLPLKSATKLCYRKLKENSLLYAELAKRWDNYPLININTEKIRFAIQKVYSVTNVPKLRSFQYRLKDYKIKDSDKCTFCHIHREELFHLFYKCKYMNTLWYNIVQLCKLPKVPTFEDILLKNILPNAKLLPNFLILLAKHFIYRMRCEKKIPLFHIFQKEITLYKNLEETIARKNNKLPLHTLKWSWINIKV